MPSLLRIPWISRGCTPAGGAQDRLFEGKLPKAIRVISPIAPFSEQSGSSALLFPLGTVWVISPTAPPSEQFGSSAYCSSLRTIWVISPIVLPVFGTARTPLRVLWTPL